MNRRTGLHDIDESGYLSMSIVDYQAWRDGGLHALFSVFRHQDINAPLTPLLSAAVYAVLGRVSIIGAYAVQLVSYGVIVLLSYRLARRLCGGLPALTAAAAVGALPLMLDYSHEYSFALPATALMTIALWAAVNSEQLTRLRWAVVLGCAAGAMVITRTMTLAFIPGLALVVGAQIAVSPNRRRSSFAVVLAVLGMLAVAAPWYEAQWSGVVQYLGSFGYGDQSTINQIGTGLWTFIAGNINQYVWVPLAAVLFAGGV
ncbi:MAG: glycosyltransferase family 39 protein, partial [Candidatus Dormibacteraeota bacterium]|nr:glycosyltransferase family 39 protein [Candidatus Dormibacteraeota bacterium]